MKVDQSVTKKSEGTRDTRDTRDTRVTNHSNVKTIKSLKSSEHIPTSDDSLYHYNSPYKKKRFNSSEKSEIKFSNQLINDSLR